MNGYNMAFVPHNLAGTAPKFHCESLHKLKPILNGYLMGVPHCQTNPNVVGELLENGMEWVFFVGTRWVNIAVQWVQHW